MLLPARVLRLLDWSGVEGADDGPGPPLLTASSQGRPAGV